MSQACISSHHSDYKFLAACLSGRSRFQLTDGLEPTYDSSETLFSFASSQYLLPALYPRLRDRSVLSNLPGDVADALQVIYGLNLERNQVILSQAQAVIGLLNSVGIEPIALKGLAYLLSGIVADRATRHLFDLDLLIPENHVSQAIDVLSEAGYVPYAGDAFAHFRHHAPPMQRADSVSVELHYSIGLGHPSSVLSSSEIIAESTPILAGETFVRLPAPEHLLIHLILHSQLHHPYHDRVFPSLRAMYDLLLLTQHFGDKLDWGAIEQRFYGHGEQTTFLLHLLQVHQTLDLPLPFAIHLDSVQKLRWLRRQLLNRYPTLRFFDPYYLFTSAFSRRFRLLSAIFSVPDGWRNALKAFCGRGSLAK
jgi:hypothetical protein